MKYKRALVRLPGKKVFQTKTSLDPFGPVDVRLLKAQHNNYCSCLKKAGLEVITLKADPKHPDSLFVEDTAVIAGGTAIITRLKKENRRGEEPAVEEALKKYKSIRNITHPATFEGGDVMRIGNTFYVGLSLRTNEEGIKQFSDFAKPLGYKVIPIDVKSKGIMHLKCVATYAGDNLVLAREDIASISEFKKYDVLSIPKKEENFVNAVSLNDRIIIAKGSNYVVSQLRKRNLNIEELDISEIRKFDGSLTCISILF